MSVSAEDVQRIAQLAAIAVDRDELTALVAQLNQIVAFVGQLPPASDEASHGFRPGPQQAPMREDVAGPIPLSLSLDAVAPATREGFIVIPRLEALDGDDG